MSKSSAKLMTEGSIWKRIVAFAIPLFWGNLFQQLYNTADSLIVGNFLGSSALAAVSSSGNRHRIRCHRRQILRCQRHSESAEVHPYNRWLRTDLRRDPYHCRYHCRTTDPGAYGNTGGGTSKLDYLFPDLLYRLTCLCHVQLLCRHSAVRR